jgi:predicted FMN-binding regulatory protein PaiB
MYMPKHFEEPRTELMHDLIRSWPLATLVTLSSSGLKYSSKNKIYIYIERNKLIFSKKNDEYVKFIY